MSINRNNNIMKGIKLNNEDKITEISRINS